MKAQPSRGRPPPPLLLLIGSLTFVFISSVVVIALGAPRLDAPLHRFTPRGGFGGERSNASAQEARPVHHHPCRPFPSCALPPRLPKYSNLCTLLDEWPPYETSAPPGLELGGLLRFNFSHDEELEAARRYRAAELPFILYSVPDLDSAGATWTDAYLREQFARTPRRMWKVERSNHGGNFLVR